MKPKAKREADNALLSRIALSSINNKEKPRVFSNGDERLLRKTGVVSKRTANVHEQERNLSQLWSGSAEILQDLGVAILDDKSNDSINEFPPPRKKSCMTSDSNSITRTRVSSPFRCVAEDLVLLKRSRTEGSSVQDQFSKLSDEILLHIFKWLPKPVLSKCAQVCKRWKSLTCDESLWKKLDLSRCNLRSGILGHLVGRGIVYLRMALTEVSGPVFMEQPISKCKLQYLDLSMATVPVNALAELLGACDSLKKLSLENCTVNDDVCRSIGQNEHLDVLNMCMCSGITVEGIRSILTGCQSLELVNFAWAHLTDVTLSCLVENIPTSVIRLNISGCRQTLVDKHIRHLAQRCPNLLELDVSDGSALTGKAFEMIVSCFKNLQHLHASHIYGCTFVHLLLLSHLENLRRLEVFGLLNDSNLQYLRQNLPRVEINKHLFSTVARPTTGNRRTRIWGMRLGD